MVLLWFISSIAWASGVDLLKRYTSSDAVKEEICGTVACTVDGPHAYAGLNISLVS